MYYFITQFNLHETVKLSSYFILNALDSYAYNLKIGMEKIYHHHMGYSNTRFIQESMSKI